MSLAENIFISWSGTRSKFAAEALANWLPNVLQAAKPWVSTINIEKGTRGLYEMNKALGGLGFGLSCLTRENLNAEWILFEAGALSKIFGDDKGRLWTYLLGDLQPHDIKPPLGQFQHTKAEKDDTRKLLHSINMAISPEGSRLSPAVVDLAFNKWWSELEQTLKQIPLVDEPEKKGRDSNEIIEEILEMCRRYFPEIAEAIQPTIRPPMFAGVPIQQNLSRYDPANFNRFATADPFSSLNRFATANPFSNIVQAPYVPKYHIKLDNEDATKTVEGTRHTFDAGELTIFNGDAVVAKFTGHVERFWQE